MSAPEWVRPSDTEWRARVAEKMAEIEKRAETLKQIRYWESRFLRMDVESREVAV